MLNINDMKLLEELFILSYVSFNNIKKIKTNNISSETKKIVSQFIDILYDGMDTALEILDIGGADL